MTSLSQALTAKAEQVLDRCAATATVLAVAESCTGGLVSASLTAIAGSSAWFDRAFVTYANQAKIDLLGVSPLLIEKHGVVSEEVARAMAEGALSHSTADATAGITGIAGPAGGSADKPVGLVHIAAARRGRDTRHRTLHLAGDRDAIRTAAALAAMDLLIEQMED
jgi:nicotinamide-nucleotide amidase